MQPTGTYFMSDDEFEDLLDMSLEQQQAEAKKRRKVQRTNNATIDRSKFTPIFDTDKNLFGLEFEIQAVVLMVLVLLCCCIMWACGIYFINVVMVKYESAKKLESMRK